MSEPITFREIKLEGGWLMVKPEKAELGKAMSLVKKHKNKLYSLEVKEYRRKRSQDANAMLWHFINRMSAILLLTPEEIYQGYIPDVGENYWIAPVLKEEIAERSADWCRGHIGRMVDDMGPCRLTELKGYHNLKMYRGSSEYDVPTFSRLLNLVLQDCRNLGIDTLSEREKSLLLDEWGKTQNA